MWYFDLMLVSWGHRNLLLNMILPVINIVTFTLKKFARHKIFVILTRSRLIWVMQQLTLKAFNCKLFAEERNYCKNNLLANDTTVQGDHKFAYLAIAFCKLCTCRLHFCTCRSRARPYLSTTENIYFADVRIMRELT